jgi:hypothetical protein
MRHARSPRLDDLEDRKLLSKAHIAAAHPSHAVAAAPLVINGTLAVDYKAATMDMNPDGSSTTVVPVSGRLGTLGVVHGDWNQSVDSYGDYEGPDTIQLRDPNGSFIIAFNDQSPGKTYKTAQGTPYFEHTQHVTGGTHAYAKATEIGSIELVTNPAKNQINSLILTTSGASLVK